MKKIYYLMIFALISTGAFAQLRSVTFQVDMLTATISADGIHAAGDWQDTAGYGGNWNPDTTLLTQVGTSNIYEVTVNIPDGKWRFKFMNGKGWGNVEGVPTENQVGGGDDNRFAHITKDTTLAAVHFAGWSPTGLKLVRLQVDVAQQTGVTSVSAAGNWQMAAGYPSDWNATDSELFVTDPNTPTVYENIYYLPADTFQLKYITNGSNWETVPTACEVGGNRELIVGNNPNVPGTVCYAMCTACPSAPTPQYPMHFMVDMQNHLKCNTMTYLDVAGSLNGWSGGDTLLDPDGDDIYEGILMVDSGEVQFKFRAHTATSDGWEGVPNRLVTLSGADTAMACFNVDGLGSYCTPIPAAADITFRVDMAQWGGSIDTAIYLIGDFTDWENNPIKMNSLGGGIYEYVYTGFCPASMFYKFVNGKADASDNSNQENTGLDSTCSVPNGIGGFNRTYTRPDANTHTLQYVFDSCDKIYIDVEEEFENVNLNLYPNPFHNQATVELSTEEMFDVSVMDMAGRVVKSMNSVNGIVTITREGLTSGIYLMVVTNEKKESNATKFIVD